MNKFDCEIIKDLLPLYADNVCSEKSLQIVEEHINECTDCAEELRKIKECPVVPTVDEDLQKAVKNAGKRIKKGKKKTVIETVALVLILVILFGVIGMYRGVLYTAKRRGDIYGDVDKRFLQQTQVFDMKPINKSDYENDSVSLYIGEKYKEETYKATDYYKLSVGKQKSITIVLYEDFQKTSMSDYLYDTFIFAKPFVRWGIELMGYNSDFAPGYDFSLYDMILEMPKPKDSFLCTPETYAVNLAYYQVFGSMMGGDQYFVIKNSDFYCHGSVFYHEEQDMYTFNVQSKQNPEKTLSIHFFGYESQDEVVEVLSSIKFK